MTHVYSRNVPESFTRGFDFEMRSAAHGGDGRTLEGYVAMFDARSRIPDRNGDFDEILRPGFADRSLKERTPIMQFDHGKDARVGSVPIGVYEVFDRDNKGYAVRGRLFDNPVVEPVRQAIAGGAIKGMSFRFTVKGRKDGDRWHRRGQGLARAGDVEVREILDADVHEAGPVVFPAYQQTSVHVRSLWAAANEEERLALIEEAAATFGRAVDLSDLTGQSIRSDGRGENGVEPREGDTSRKEARNRAWLAAMRNPVTLP